MSIKLKKSMLMGVVCFYLSASNLGFATSSADVKPESESPMASQTNVDTSNCTSPIKSSPYVIVFGNGGANMSVTCPANYPIMHTWKQQVGFGGIGAVSHGGGSSSIVCCAVKRDWVSSLG